MFHKSYASYYCNMPSKDIKEFGCDAVSERVAEIGCLDRKCTYLVSRELKCAGCFNQLHALTEIECLYFEAGSKCETKRLRKA